MDIAHYLLHPNDKIAELLIFDENEDKKTFNKCENHLKTPKNSIIYKRLRDAYTQKDFTLNKFYLTLNRILYFYNKI